MVPIMLDSQSDLKLKIVSKFKSTIVDYLKNQYI